MKIVLLTFAATAADKTENFYKNGLERISSDFTTIITNSDLNDATIARHVSGMEKLVERIQAKHDKLNGRDVFTFPALEGEFDIDGSSDIDLSKTCQALNLLKNDLKNWVKFFVEATVRECNGSKCFTPSEGPLKSVETHQNWHNRNTERVQKINKWINGVIKFSRQALLCGKFQDNIVFVFYNSKKRCRSNTQYENNVHQESVIILCHY